MKTFKHFILLGATALMGIFTSCEDAEYSALGVHGFISESTGAVSSKVVIAAGGANTTITACLSEAIGEDAKFKFVIDPSILSEYNKSQSTSYLVLPESGFEMDAEITIKAGELSAPATNIHIKEFTPEMAIESYALPLKLVSVDNKVPTMPKTGSFVITTENITTFSLPMYTAGAGFKADMPNGPETYEAFTIEARFQLSNTGNRNRMVFANNSEENDKIFLRFEDPQNPQNGIPAHSWIQVVGRQGKFLNPSIHIEANKWQHYAITFDGSAYRLYVNGGFAGMLDIPDGPHTFKEFTWFGEENDSWWSGCNMLMTEMRVWSVCRTDAQIQNNMTTVGTKSPGLEAYWRLSDGKTGDGTSYNDLTGKGHTLKTSKKPAKWINNIMSSDTTTPWE